MSVVALGAGDTVALALVFDQTEGTGSGSTPFAAI